MTLYPDYARYHRLRALQSRWLEIPMIRRHIELLGWGGTIAGPGTPKLVEVRDRVLPGWQGWFEEWFETPKGDTK